MQGSTLRTVRRAGIDGEAVAQELNQAASQELEESVGKFRQDVLAEAARLEAAMHSAGSAPDITATHIHDANVYLRHPYYRPKRLSFGAIALQILALGSGAVIGVGTEKLETSEGQLMFAGGLVLGAVTTVANLVRGS